MLLEVLGWLSGPAAARDASSMSPADGYGRSHECHGGRVDIADDMTSGYGVEVGLSRSSEVMWKWLDEADDATDGVEVGCFGKAASMSAAERRSWPIDSMCLRLVTKLLCSVSTHHLVSSSCRVSLAYMTVVLPVSRISCHTLVMSHGASQRLSLC